MITRMKPDDFKSIEEMAQHGKDKIVKSEKSNGN